MKQQTLDAAFKARRQSLPVTDSQGSQGGMAAIEQAHRVSDPPAPFLLHVSSHYHKYAKHCPVIPATLSSIRASGGREGLRLSKRQKGSHTPGALDDDDDADQEDHLRHCRAAAEGRNEVEQGFEVVKQLSEHVGPSSALTADNQRYLMHMVLNADNPHHHSLQREAQELALRAYQLLITNAKMHAPAKQDATHRHILHVHHELLKPCERLDVEGGMMPLLQQRPLTCFQELAGSTAQLAGALAAGRELPPAAAGQALLLKYLLHVIQVDTRERLKVYHDNKGHDRSAPDMLRNSIIGRMFSCLCISSTALWADMGPIINKLVTIITSTCPPAVPSSGKSTSSPPSKSPSGPEPCVMGLEELGAMAAGLLTTLHDFYLLLETDNLHPAVEKLTDCSKLARELLTFTADKSTDVEHKMALLQVLSPAARLQQLALIFAKHAEKRWSISKTVGGEVMGLYAGDSDLLPKLSDYANGRGGWSKQNGALKVDPVLLMRELEQGEDYHEASKGLMLVTASGHEGFVAWFTAFCCVVSHLAVKGQLEMNTVWFKDLFDKVLEHYEADSELLRERGHLPLDLVIGSQLSIKAAKLAVSRMCGAAAGGTMH